MTTKKSDMKSSEISNSGSNLESESNPDSESETSTQNPWDLDTWRRPDVVDAKRVLETLSNLALPTDGSASERTQRLEAYYAHEAQKRAIEVARCVPDFDGHDQGCGYASNIVLSCCPFCGLSGEVQAAKPVPVADPYIEHNVASAKKANATKAKEKAAAVAKVTSKDVKKKKKDRGEPVADKPAETKPESEAVMIPKSDAVAIDLPTENPGGTLADLDRLIAVIRSTDEGMQRNQAVGMWTIGKAIAEIRDKKLWALVTREEGGYAYSGVNVMAAQLFGYSTEYVAILVRIVSSFTQEQAAIGSAKAKLILGSKFPDDITKSLVEFASEKDEKGDFVHSLVDLQLKIRGLRNPQLPAPAQPVLATSDDGPDSAEDDDVDRDDGSDEEDDDEPTNRPASTTKPVQRPAQMTSVNFPSREFSIPLVQNGSQIYPAKKIQDEPHATFALPNGKIHFTVRIGEDGQLFLDGKLDMPY